MARLLCFCAGAHSRHARVFCLWLGSLLAVLPGNAGLQEGLAAYRSGNYALALQEFRHAAAAGDLTAIVSIGFMYLRGEGVSPDPQEARRWLQLAAEQGVAPAQHSLALLYYEGRGVERNAAVAANYFESAALQGLADAQYNLGILYSRGDGVKQDWTLARFWQEKAAAQGLSDAQLALGAMAAHGLGVPRDFQQAAAWFGRAAANGNARAQRLLETAFSDLAGIPGASPGSEDPDIADAEAALTDSDTAADTSQPSEQSQPSQPSPQPSPSALPATTRPDGFWTSPPSALSEPAFRDLQGQAAAGDADAQIRLAWHYLHGVSAPQSLVRGYVWAARAGRRAHPDSPALSAGFAQRMSARQLSIARTILDPPRK